jgi:tetratricopeptide (TPR) repeat protein
VNRHQRRAAKRQRPNLGPARPQFVSEGVKHHQAGRLDRASAFYLKALVVQPNDAAALHLLGILRYQQGSFLEAVALITKAIAIKPNFPEAHSNLGMTLCELGRPVEGEASCREALRLRPDYPEAHSNLGMALYNLHRLAEAEASYREALRLRPMFPEAHSNLGNTLRDLNRLAEAEASYREALRLRPDFPNVHNNLGNTLRDLNRLAEAEASYRKAVRLRPDYPDFHNNLGVALYDLGSLAEAEASYREALRIRPDSPTVHNNLGNTLRDLNRLVEAEASYREALRLRPDSPDVHNNLGNTFRDLNRLAEAEASYREAVRLRPDHSEAHTNLALALLLTGQFEEGWEEYEWRPSRSDQSFLPPLWRGEAIGDRVILLRAEQGLGDTLQFCRYVPLVAAAGRTILEVQAPLVRLLSGLDGITVMVAQGDMLPSFDLHCPLLSLPRVLGTTLDTIPATTPYLIADPALAADWRKRLTDVDGLRVGLVWAGGQQLAPAIDRRRSIALDSLAPLGEVSGVSLVSLQKSELKAQDTHPPRGLMLLDFTADLHDFADTAALIDGLDLVISVDTAVAHLAGALGKPVWLLNRFDTCWRWLLNRDDSPWYPTMRQFRQPRPGDWNSVICGVRDALNHLAVGDRSQIQPRQNER